MQRHYRDLLKHSSIYGLGLILSRLASFLLLPFYTRYLKPADYGCIAILDLTASFLATVIGSGMAAAVNRYHFEVEGEAARDRVWWTGLTFLALMATIIVIPCWVARDEIARLALGPEVPRGRDFLGLVLATLWLNSVVAIPETYLRVQKRSGLSVGIALSRLLLNIALNVLFLAFLDLGVGGVLLGNMIAAAAALAAQAAIFIATRGPFTIHIPLMGKLWRFGWPLVISGLLTTVMQQSDRYLLRLYSGMDQVGIYSLAVALAQAVNSLYFAPFNKIWNVTLYEVAVRPDAKRVYARVFQHSIDGALVLIFGIALFSRPLVYKMTALEYAAAADLVPVVCLARVFLQAASQFHGPINLSMRTFRLVPAITIGISLNFAANMLLIPTFGATGAAWAAVLSFAGYAAVCLAFARAIERIDYPIGRCACYVAALSGVYIGFRQIDMIAAPVWSRHALAAILWLTATYLLVGPLLTRAMQLVRPKEDGARVLTGSRAIEPRVAVPSSAPAADRA